MRSAFTPLLYLFICCTCILNACKEDLSVDGEYRPSSSNYKVNPFLSAHIPENDTFNLDLDSLHGFQELYTEDSIRILINVDSIWTESGDTARGTARLEV
ncbi:MAG: hypothetical protein ACPF8V_04655, partial [Luteibaculum sp.]